MRKLVWAFALAWLSVGATYGSAFDDTAKKVDKADRQILKGEEKEAKAHKKIDKGERKRQKALRKQERKEVKRETKALEHY